MNELSLFSGYGGFSLGLRLAGLQTRTVAYVEWDKYPQEILKARIRDGYLSDAPIFSDISSFRGEQFRGMVDIITGGFPCQPHSVAGLKRGASDDRNLWPETLRVIREVGPRYVILENVPGLLSASSNGGTPAYGGTVVGELASIGYGVHWRTIGAEDVGASHKRKRWWCIGVADSERERKLSGRRGSPRIQGSRVQAANPSVRQGRETRIEERVWQDGAGDIRHNANNGSGSGDSELAESTSDGLYPSESRIILPNHGPSTPGEDAAEASRCSPSGELDDPEHDGQPRPQDPRGTGPRVHPPRRAIQPEQLTGPGISATGGDELADSRQQPTGAEGRGLDGGWEDAGAEARVGATERNGFADGDNSLADSDSDSVWDGQQLQGQRRPASSAQSWAGHTDEELGYATTEGSQVSRRERTTLGQPTTESQPQRPGVLQLPTWPPSPSDTDAWERVLRERPDLAPALDKEAESQFRRVADGATHRLDIPPANDRVNRLKALGNGLVPAVAAEFLRQVIR